MKKRKITLLVVGALLMTGCAPKRMLVKDVTQEQLGKDNGECRLEAQKATQFDLSGNVFIQQNKQNQALENCLQAKGYTYQQESNEQQKSIEARYIQAVTKQNKNQEPLTEYIINVCRPKEDKEYISCINEKKDEYINTSLFPELEVKMFNARKEFEQQLIRKDITRKEFKEYVEKLYSDSDNKVKDRMQNDIRTGVYTGKY